MADLRKERRPTLTIELIRQGDKLRRTYHMPASHALEHVQVIDNYRDIGALCAYGDLRGIDAVRAVLVESSGEELRQGLSRNRLDGVGRLFFDVLFGVQTNSGRDRELYEILRTAFQEPDPERKPTPKDKPLRVRILARDHELAALPWQATMWRDEPLVQWPNPWSFELVSAVEMTKRRSMRLPARILIVAPDLPVSEDEHAQGLAGTTTRHLRALKPFFERMHRSNDVRIVRRAAEMERLIAEFTPHVVYFFGHGDTSDKQNRLVLAEGERILVRDVAAWLKKPNQQVDLVFLNACSSGQAGWHSAWWQLRDAAPVVISNAMDAFRERAASYAQAFFERWWADLLEPAHAANVPPSQTENLFDWATAIVHTNYETFHFERGPIAQQHVQDAEFWCDRDPQRAIAYKHVSDLCKAPTQRVEAIICCGTPTSHIDLIPRQCIDYIHSETRDIHIQRHRVQMPRQRAPELSSAHFELQLKLDFGFGIEKDLRAILSVKAPRPSGNAHRVLWLDWGVLKNQKKYSKDLEAWLVFVRDVVARACPPEIRIVTSLEVEAERDVVVKLAEKVKEYRVNDDFRTPEFWCSGLAPLDYVERVDIVTFLYRHGCDKVDKVSHAIFGQTAGNYAETTYWLRIGLTEGWPVVLDRLRQVPSKTEDEDV